MIFEKISQLIAEKFNISADTLTLDTKLKEDLAIDSLDSVELVMELEDVFSISIKDEEAASLKTVGDIVNYIKTHTT